MDKKTQHILGQITREAQQKFGKDLYKEVHQGDMRPVIDEMRNKRGLTNAQREKLAKYRSMPQVMGEAETVINEKAASEYSAYMDAQVKKAMDRGDIKKANPRDDKFLQRYA